MTIVRVKVLFFGMLKDIVGRSEEQIDVADGARLESVFTSYARQFSSTGDRNVWETGIVYRFLFPAWKGKSK